MRLLLKHVRDLHKKHPQLGHDGIGKLLASEGTQIDGRELKAFMQDKKIRVAPAAHWENSSDVMSAFGAGLTKKGKGL